MIISKVYTPSHPKSRVIELIVDEKVWKNPKLTASQKIIFALTQLFEDPDCHGLCYASNKAFTKYLKESQATISRDINKLINMGYIEVAKFDGRVRWMRTKHPDPIATKNNGGSKKRRIIRRNPK